MTSPAEVLSLPKPAWVSEDVAMLYDMAHRFLSDEVAPHYDAYEKNEIVERSAWENAGAAGLLCPSMPEEYGGSGLGITEAALLMQTVAESGAALQGALALAVLIAVRLATA